jgi:hypothetical protein
MKQLEWEAKIEHTKEFKQGERVSVLMVWCKTPEPMVDDEGKEFCYAIAQGSYPTDDPFRLIKSRNVFDWGQFGADLRQYGTVLENCIDIVNGILQKNGATQAPGTQKGEK